MKILAVIRESTVQQETESQRKEMLQFCLSLGYNEKNIAVLEVAGASAYKVDTAYLRLIETIKATLLNDPELDTVAFWHLNRLGRNDEILVSMKNWFIKNHIQVYIKNPYLTLLDERKEVIPASEMIWNIYAAMVKEETKEIFEKTKRGKNRNSEQGRFNGGTVLFGYKVDENGYLIPDQEEAAIIRNIYEMYATGKYSFETLVVELNELGVLIRGKKATFTIVRNLLSYTAYTTGRVDYNGVHRNYVPIIEKELAEKVYNVRKNQDLKIHGKTDRLHIATRILKCAECGGNYCYCSGKSYHCYNAIRRKDRERKCTCSTQIKAAVIDSLIWHNAKLMYSIDYATMKDSEQTELNKEKQILLTKVATLEKEIKESEPTILKYADLYAEGIYTKEQYNMRLAKILSKNKQNKEQIEAYNNRIAIINEAVANYKNRDWQEKLADDITANLTDKERYDIAHKYVSIATVEKQVINKLKYAVIEIKAGVPRISETMAVKTYAYCSRSHKTLLELVNGQWIETGIIDDVIEKTCKIKA